MLKADVLAGVEAAKVAVQDLAVAAQLVKRGAPIHVPGNAPTYTETTYPIMVVLVSFKTKEIDNDRIRASDRSGLIFPEVGQPVPEPNDLLRGANGMEYRILYNDKVMAGDTVALSQVHLRQL
jgi:hypothetical protein